MKKSLLTLGLISLFSTSVYALGGKDRAEGSCELTLKKNKTSIKALRTSSVRYENILIAPLGRYAIYEDLKRVYINPEEKTKIHKNAILVFASDTERVDSVEGVALQIVDGGRRIPVTIEYIGKGASAGSHKGPALRVNKVNQNGTLGEDIYKLTEKGIDFKFEAFPTLVNPKLKSNEEPVAIASERQERKMFLSCSFKLTDLAVVQTEDIAPTNGDVIDVIQE